MPEADTPPTAPAPTPPGPAPAPPPTTPAPPPATPVLTAAGIDKSFAGVHALRGVDLVLRAGRVHALVGENGAGKSTLIKVLTGVHRPDAGRIELAGRQVAFRTPLEAQRAGISTVYQEVNLVPMVSVARNLFLGREPRRRGLLDVRRMNREAAALLARYGVRAEVSRPLRELGLGAQQMVALARAVQLEARVVVMDEPTSSLEPREVDTLFGVVRELTAQGIAVVYVSHRLDELYALCDEVTVLRDGRVVHSGDLAGLGRRELVALMLGREPGPGTRAPGTRRAPVAAVAGDDVPVLRAEGLTVRHKVRGVGFALRRGEVLGLGGLLGSGRSETAKAVVGALGADAGRVEVAGRVLARRSPAAAVRAGVVLLPEDRKAEGIVPGLSVRENIVLAALPRLSRAGLVSRARQDRIVETFMTRLRIKAASPEQKVSDLSGGNQQKVLLARWLCLGPKVLLLDEPTRGIDVGARAEVQALVDELAAEGLGVLLISSDAEELIAGADRVLVLKDGAVVEELTGASVSADGLLAALSHDPDDPPDDPDDPRHPDGPPDDPHVPHVPDDPDGPGRPADLDDPEGGPR
ncbi:sugar ABC transporter ATP-binding protein [Kitasatospora cineracea]|uniref:Monosaccharide ABC transporter ATP-binding protein (CUT2 family) n=1 Tax=Kitasatospora cineracea TaxID=88074 RepID=A0A3N4RKX1_9ACTN|nr:sugar ABC transporter ATP-binding protein [Kitasatospora cineracea]RPE27680.1 monosaccharide ABC transporter ATP-binding protein (CUT2 family) [Kitasatospora cineracea]